MIGKIIALIIVLLIVIMIYVQWRHCQKGTGGLFSKACHLLFA